MKSLYTLMLLVLSSGAMVMAEESRPVVLSGLEVEIRNGCPHLSGKRVGLVCNHTAITHEREFAVDALRRCGANIVRLFSPEHGLRGDAPAGEKIESGTDPVTGIPVVSLYGQRHRPTMEELLDLDILVYDIQDVGVRFYTRIWILRECMVAAADAGTPFLVLDRPGLVGPRLEGNVLDERFASFVGQKPLAWRFGMTIGELATLYNQQGWLDEGRKAELTVVKLEGYRHDLWGEDMGLPWIATSPNIPTLTTCLHYPGTCLFEGLSNVSEGRGTEKPFEYVGAPFVDADTWKEKMDAWGLPGVRFEAVTFTPISTPGKVNHPKFEGEKCHGLHLVCTDREKYRPVMTSIALIEALLEMYPGQIEFREGAFDRLAGTDRVRRDLLASRSHREIIERIESSLEGFARLRNEALLYE